MMPCVVKLWGVLGRSALDGMYLRAYDAEAHNGRGHIITTPDRANAMRFDDAGHVMRVYRAVPKCHPRRETDGRPNRPLTAYTVEVESIETTTNSCTRPIIAKSFPWSTAGNRIYLSPRTAN